MLKVYSSYQCDNCQVSFTVEMVGEPQDAEGVCFPLGEGADTFQQLSHRLTRAMNCAFCDGVAHLKGGTIKMPFSCAHCKQLEYGNPGGYHKDTGEALCRDFECSSAVGMM